MKAHWTTAALLTTALVAGCNSQDAQDIDDTTDALAEDSTVGDTTDSAGRTSPDLDTPAPTPSRSTSAPARPAPAPRAAYRELLVPAGTALPVTLQTALSSETATVEMPVRARLSQAVTVDGLTVFPAGTELAGTVTEVAQSGRVKGRARVSLAFTEAIVDGARLDLTTDPITFEAEGTQGEDATKIGVGAGIGAAIGGILGGGSGAAKGAAIGGAAGTGAVLATKGQHVEVPEGTEVSATLASPFEMRVRVE